ncbi:adenosylcobinamide-phosphate synthase CbiB [Falsirhodobacter halotolerans]|uniref:adenosylcobinamide-phosphate synthase CbiB n=1 Tax=Falsirhodobacter halotolerans TaxID=1146892 RepID=UPI001FCFDAEF|nr:adenosylcobinamide-phosphate synthase CbiB [Falsirhodobacter halotolerans]MCJ8139027.1 adenosylcobinamide-phosphate synthase CbiB [Falsirhodobacter halotolerans]
MSGALLLALLIEGAFGWPARLHARIGHPVTWIGALIAALDRRWNRGRARRVKGLAAALVVIGVAAGMAAVVSALLPDGAVGVVLSGVLAAPLVATRSLHDHVAAVARPLAAGDMDEARRAVSMIVGRDPARLDAPAIARAATESLAENTSDGIIAPLFWGLIFGLPGIAAYKAINTLDSMIGHRTPRHEAFGWAAARIDDAANLIPARLTGALFAVAGGGGWRAMWADARRHRSPNAGWPEAAMAGALGIRLSGPRIYDGAISPEPWLNATGRDPAPADLFRALALFRRAMLGVGMALAVGAFL